MQLNWILPIVKIYAENALQSKGNLILGESFKN